MNFLYLSPNFPTYGWKFCHFLKENGVNVIAIGDAPYDSLQKELKEDLAEYYYCPNMTDYDAIYKATACLISHHGRIDYVRSNNEFWLITEAKLRNDFNIPGIRYPEILEHKQKSAMKAYFKKAKVDCAKYCLPTNFDEGKAFTDENGFPVVVKPDDGVGACSTYTLHNEQEMAEFFATKPDVQYIMEEFIDGHVETFDGMTDANGDIVFCASQIYHQSLMDTVVNDDCIMYHNEPVMAKDLEKAGRAVVKAYGIKELYFHFEFFRTIDKKTGKSKIMALEVNMRPPGGMITEIYEASHDVNIYKLWADTLVFGKPSDDTTPKRYSAYVGRKYRFSYKYTHEQICDWLKDHLYQEDEILGIITAAMGNHYYLLYSDNLEELQEMINLVDERV
ncbi:MAG: ATP-grasp domain-containing protein [Alphaproteobacteria bacterium]|nr:ATP-grasp domain-containing protein [Alphaproteobacteria bacterium]